MALSKKKREELYHKYGGRCAYCGEPLPERWHADHIEAVIRTHEYVRDDRGRLIFENGRPKIRKTGMMREHLDHMDNMNPSCPPCNLYKSCYSLEGWRKAIRENFQQYIQRNQALRCAKRFVMLEIIDKPVVFWFEEYERMQEEAENESR